MAHPKRIAKITLKDMIFHWEKYYTLPEWLIKFPVPDYIKIDRKMMSVPQNLDEFTNAICYGQRIFMVRKEDNDFGHIIRVMDGYYYSSWTKKKWDADEALLFGKKVLTCRVEHLYPVAMQLTNLLSELADREHKLLHREPSKMELAAGIEKLNVFSEMTALHFLRDAMKITVPEVLLTPYNECLVHFMIAKETNDYQLKYYELAQEEAKSKQSKYFKK
jgi:hypothetical protein